MTYWVMAYAPAWLSIGVRVSIPHLGDDQPPALLLGETDQAKSSVYRLARSTW